MIIKQAHIIDYDNLDQKAISLLQYLDGDSFVKVSTINGEYYSESIDQIYHVWTVEDMIQKEFFDDDIIIVDPEYPQQELLKKIGFKFSGQKTESGYLIFFRG